MSIDSLSSLKTSDISRSARDKSRDLKSAPNQSEKQPTPVSIIRAGDTRTFEQADTFKQEAQAKPNLSLNEKTAIDAYQSVEKEQKRQDIQQLLGVDTFV